MNKLMERLEKSLNKYVLPVADRINSNHVITAIKEGMMATMPVILIASIFLILTNFPFLNEFAPGAYAWLNDKFAFVYTGTMGLLSLYVVIGTSNAYAKLKNIDSLYGIMVALGSFFCLS